jgi:hypothetical protein
MKVKELIDILKKEDQNAIVVLSIDEEGNGFETVVTVEGDNKYCTKGNCRGEIRLKELTEELENAGYGEEDCAPKNDKNWVDAVVLWP